MPRATKKDPFCIYAARSSGYWKGKRFIYVNPVYEGDHDQLTLHDLILFLREHDVDPVDVKIERGFKTYAIVK